MAEHNYLKIALRSFAVLLQLGFIAEMIQPCRIWQQASRRKALLHSSVHELENTAATQYVEFDLEAFSSCYVSISQLASPVTHTAKTNKMRRLNVPTDADKFA